MLLDPNAAVHGARLLPSEHASQEQYREERGKEVLPDGVIHEGDSAGRVNRRWESEQVQRSRNFTGGDTIADVEFAIDLLHMGFDCVDGNHQVTGNLPIRATGNQQAQHSLLLGRQCLNGRWPP